MTITTILFVLYTVQPVGDFDTGMAFNTHKECSFFAEGKLAPNGFAWRCTAEQRQVFDWGAHDKR